MKGGSIQNCMHAFANMIDTAAVEGRDLLTAQYDLSQAYDRVSWLALTHALRRLSVPFPFIRLITSLLSSTELKFLTAFGLTDGVKPSRSVPQGDPIAPLLFVITIDPLFDALDSLKAGFAHLSQQPGPVARTAAKAYADDISTYSDSPAGMLAQHELIVAFFDTLDIPLNFNKTVLICTETRARGPNLTDTQLLLRNPAKGNALDRVPITPADEAVRYLGFWPTLTQSMSVEIDKVTKKLTFLLSMAQMARLPPYTLRLFLHSYVYSMLEHHFSVFHFPSKTLLAWDTKVAWAFSRAVRTGMGTCLKPAAVAVLFNVHLPSTRFMGAHYTNLIRLLNNTSPLGAQSRALWKHSESEYTWARIARDSGIRINLRNQRNRFVRARVYLNTPLHSGAIGATLDIAPSPQRALTKLVSWDEGPLLPTFVNHENAMVPVDLSAVTPFSCTGYGEDLSVHACTDGSFDSNAKSGKFGFVIITDWLARNFMMFHKSRCRSEQDVLRLMQTHQHQLVFRFASLPPGHAYSSTDTELRAIHLFELSCPVNARISAWSDSKNCATLVPHLTHGSEEQIRYRTRNSEMRATAMAIFNLNQRYVEIAGPAGEPKINVEWVKGHSEEENLYAVGNRMIDALLRTGTPAMESPLPSLLDGEPAPGFALLRNATHVVGNHRSVLMREQRTQAESAWANSPSQGRIFHLYPEKMLKLISLIWRLAKTPKFGNLPAFMARLLTSTLPYLSHFPQEVPKPCFLCGRANETCNSHLFDCPALQSVASASLAQAGNILQQLIPKHRRVLLSASFLLHTLWDLSPRPLRAPPWPPPGDALFVASHLGLFPSTSMHYLTHDLEIPSERLARALPRIQTCFLEAALLRWGVFRSLMAKKLFH